MPDIFSAWNLNYKQIKILLRENITEETRTTEQDETETYYSYDEYELFIPYRSNYETYIADNQTSLLAKAKQDEKDKKLAELDVEKRKRLNAGFYVDGVLFDSDNPAELRYTQLALKFASNPEYTTQWKAANNIWVTMDAVLFTQIQTAFEAHIAGVYEWLGTEQAKL